MRRFISAIRWNRSFFLVLLCVIGLASCSTQKPTPLRVLPPEAADSVALVQLCEKRIVLLGDGAHGHRYYYQLVLKILARWMISLETEFNSVIGERSAYPLSRIGSEKVPLKLVLFLEMDTVHANAINDYLRTGDLDPYLMHWADGMAKWSGNELFSVDRVEFLSGLRKIQQRIGAMNSANPGQIVDLAIRGPESLPPYDWKDRWVNKDFNDQISIPWFAHVRDKEIAHNIESFLSANPDYKALVFYGTGHLERRETDKRRAVSNKPGSPMMDYFLAHFLDEHLGRRSVCVLWTNPSQGVGNSFEGLAEYSPDARWSDYILTSKLNPRSPLPVLIVNSKRYLDVLLRLANDWSNPKDDLEWSLAAATVRTLTFQLQRSSLRSELRSRSSLDTLFALLKTRESFSRSHSKAIALLSSLVSRFDAVHSIDQTQRWFFPTDSSAKQFYWYMIPMVLANVPSDSVRVPVSAEEMNVARWNELKEYLLIGLVQIGTEREQERALEELRRRTGKDFRSPEDCVAWWYGRYRIP